MKKLLLIFCIIFPVYGQIFNLEEDGIDSSTARAIGHTVKRSLETEHYRKMAIDDDVSLRAFGLFLKRIDFAKELLFQSDVEASEFFAKIRQGRERGEASFLNSKLTVTNYKDSVRRVENILPEDEERWSAEFEELGHRWVDKLQKDIYLDESLNVMRDMIYTMAKQY